MRALLLIPLFTLACRAEVEPIDDDADGFVAAQDCNDADAAVNPDATEACNGIDDDCSGVVDDDPTDAETFYSDADGDGYGNPTRSTTACDAPDGYVADATDCDDGDPDFHPGAIESDCADPADYNCDGTSGFADADADGFAACQDCDDASAAVNPDAQERCDGIDNDCDGATDPEGSAGEETWYADADGDGFGDPRKAESACEAPSGYVTNADDCNDAAAAARPGGAEVCDGYDNDCDGKVDANASDAKTWYPDADADGHGGSGAVKGCEQPVGFVEVKGDCNDADNKVFPGATETCDRVDNDCDTQVDEDFDKDADGYTTCAGDCDDASANANPGKKEACNGSDDDCDGDVDEKGATGETTWYLDYDGDGFGGDKLPTKACDAPTGFADNTDDCDDLDDAYNPDAAPGCDGEDYDCDGLIDNDDDKDGYADITCGGDDCDDSKSSVKPEPGGGCALGTSCKDLLDRGIGKTSGAYTLDPDGFGTGVDPFDAWCDQTTDGGGWTMVFKMHHVSAHVNAGPAGTTLVPCGFDPTAAVNTAKECNIPKKWTAFKPTDLRLVSWFFKATPAINYDYVYTEPTSVLDTSNNMLPYTSATHWRRLVDNCPASTNVPPTTDTASGGYWTDKASPGSGGNWDIDLRDSRFDANCSRNGCGGPGCYEQATTVLYLR